jgi:hypothetical protein
MGQFSRTEQDRLTEQYQDAIKKMLPDHGHFSAWQNPDGTMHFRVWEDRSGESYQVDMSPFSQNGLSKIAEICHKLSEHTKGYEEAWHMDLIAGGWGE